MNEYIGYNYQLFGVQKYELLESKAQGMKFYHAKNGLGLEMDISLNRNGDISNLSYKGYNLNYLSPCGYVNSSYYDKKDNGFLSSFTAGFLTTCGLTTFGSPSIDEGVELGLHGNISNTPTENSSYEIVDDKIIIKTLTLDENIFSYKLSLNRTITLSLKDNSFTIVDAVKNNGDSKVPLMVLYHMNLGYPLLDEDLLLHINYKNISGRNELANSELDKANLLLKPTKNYIERCYYYEMNENPFAAVFNKKLDFGMKISYKKENLDSFTEWKMMGVRDYVLGLEPGTNYPDGRKYAREHNTLKFINPNETKTFEIKVEIIENLDKYLSLIKEK